MGGMSAQPIRPFLPPRQEPEELAAQASALAHELFERDYERFVHLLTDLLTTDAEKADEEEHNRSVQALTSDIRDEFMMLMNKDSRAGATLILTLMEQYNGAVEEHVQREDMRNSLHRFWDDFDKPSLYDQL